jgi:hypothetical protein
MCLELLFDEAKDEEQRKEAVSLHSERSRKNGTVWKETQHA